VDERVGPPLGERERRGERRLDGADPAGNRLDRVAVGERGLEGGGGNWADPSSLEWTEREPREGEAHGRVVADLTEALDLRQSRARLWRYPAHTSGRRHADKAQEEVFVVVSGELTMLLGDPAERVDVGKSGVVAVQPGTPLQVRNESDDDLVLYIYGAPAVQEGADFFDDVPLPARSV